MTEGSPPARGESMRRTAVILVMFLGACGGGSKGNKCVAGQSSACACTNGSMGAQTCNADGTFGVCVCGGGVDGGTGTGGTGGMGVDAGPPTMGVGSRMIVPGPLLLVGSGQNSCTNQAPAGGDRWCAVAMPSTLSGFV